MTVVHSKDIYFVLPEEVEDDHLAIKDNEFHHLMHVLRRREGDFFTAVDGKGTAYDCQIIATENSKLFAKILKKTISMGEPAFKLTLALAIPKKDKFEWVIEKGTEAGISKFIPLLTKRTLMTAKSIKPDRCFKIALSAMKQSCRSHLPEISEPKDWMSVLHNSCGYDVKLVAHEKEKDSNLDNILRGHLNRSEETSRSGILCIGPEGGFAEEEIERAVEHGYSIFGMGPRRLRTETAALIGATLIMDRMGEFK